MKSIYCPRCWTELNVGLKRSGSGGMTVASCPAPACSATFSEPEVDDIRINITKSVPAVDALTAARMIGIPGKPELAMAELREGAVLHNNLVLIQLPTIRMYGDRKGISIAPAGTPTVWVEVR
jgi:hypothetical protein